MCKTLIHPLNTDIHVIVKPFKTLVLYGVYPGESGCGAEEDNNWKDGKHECDCSPDCEGGCSCQCCCECYCDYNDYDDDGYRVVHYRFPQFDHVFNLSLTDKISGKVYRYIVQKYDYPSGSHYSADVVEDKCDDSKDTDNVHYFFEEGSCTNDRALIMRSKVKFSTEQEFIIRITENMDEKKQQKIIDIVTKIYKSPGMPGEHEPDDIEPDVLDMLEAIYYSPGMPGSAIPWTKIRDQRFAKLLE